MEIIYGEKLSEYEYSAVKNIADECGVLFDTARLLYLRGIDSPEKAAAFLSPGKKRFHSPFLFDNMKAAVERINAAKIKGESVLVFGDYDADGVSAVTVLYHSLKEFGITPVTVIPEREDGYGLNEGIIEKLRSENKIDLIITVDCGISDCEKIENLKKLGIDVIVTDHHEPPEILPDCIVINPKVKGEKYPFGGLCGAGVAYKLSYALIGEKANGLLDFVTVATVADSMELVGENRDLVYEGLKLINSARVRKCLKFLLGDKDREVSAQTIAFTIAPRVNAGGRMGDAASALKLFTSEDENVCFDLAVKLNEYNVLRQAECENIYRSAKEKIKAEKSFKDDVILVYDDGWKTGFVGIVAARLAEEFSRPVIVFAGYGGLLKGSARSVDAVNIFEVISSAGEFTVAFGGHSQAAGVTVEKEKFRVFKEKLLSFMKENYGEIEAAKRIYAEWNIEGELSLRFAREIERLEPFGVGNRRPCFTAEAQSVISRPLKNGSVHYSFRVSSLDMLDFNGAGDVELLAMPVKKRIVFETNLSTFKGREYLKGYVKQVVPFGGYADAELFLFQRELEALESGEPFIAENYEETDAGIELKRGFGTFFAVANTETLKRYENLSNLQISFFKPETENFSNCIVVSPSFVPEGYDRVVYLDRPLAEKPNSAKKFLAKNSPAAFNLGKIDTDRSAIAVIYDILKRNRGKEFLSPAWFYSKRTPCDNAYQFVFAAATLMELKIFNAENGVLNQDITVKNPLTNSKVYSKIDLIRG